MAYKHKPSGSDRDGGDSDIEAIPFDTEPVRRLKQERSGKGVKPGKAGTTDPFVKGPIAISWINACSLAHVEGLHLALGIKARAGVFPDGWVPVGGSLSRLLEMSDDTRRRALLALEGAGLVEVVREPGKPPAARLLEMPAGAS